MRLLDAPVAVFLAVPDGLTAVVLDFAVLVLRAREVEVLAGPDFVAVRVVLSFVAPSLAALLDGVLFAGAAFLGELFAFVPHQFI